MLRTHAYTLYYLAGTMDRQEASDSACVAWCSPCCIHPPMLKHCLYAWHSCISFDWSCFSNAICNELPFQGITFSVLPSLLNFLDEDSQKEETSAEGSGKAKGNIGQGITGHTVWHPEIHGIQQSRALAHSSGTRTYVHLYLIYDLGRSRQIYSVMHALHPTACRMHRSPHCMKDPHASTPLGSFENSACFIWLVSVGWELLSVTSLTR